MELKAPWVVRKSLRATGSALLMYTVPVLRRTRVSGQGFDRLSILETTVVSVVGRDSVIGIATR
jgi:hypothetical protein